MADSTGYYDSNLDPANGESGWRGWLQAGGIQNASSFGADRNGNSDTPQLSFFRNRIYDQRSGQWTQEDPAGLAGGVNLYQYAGNDPVGNTDPFGLCPLEKDGIPCTLTMAGAGAVADALAGAADGAIAGTAVEPGGGTLAGGIGGGVVGGAVGLLLGGATGAIRDVVSIASTTGATHALNTAAAAISTRGRAIIRKAVAKLWVAGAAVATGIGLAAPGGPASINNPRPPEQLPPEAKPRPLPKDPPTGSK